MKKITRRNFLKVASASLAAAAFASCSAESTATSTATSTAGSTADAAAAEPITLTLLDQCVAGDAVGQAFHKRLDAYLEENTHVTIEEESLTTGDLATKLQTLAAAGELPDVFQMKGQMAKSFAENGYVYDMTDFLDRNSEWAADFKSGSFSNFECAGGVYGVPFQITNTCVFYHKDIFEACGIDSFPETWSELIEACKDMRAMGVTPIVFGNADLWNAESCIMSTLGNRVHGDEWYDSIRNNSGAKWTDDEFVNALQALYDLAAAGGFNADVNSVNGDVQNMYFMNGEGAMTINGSWAVMGFEDGMSQEMKENLGLAILPAVEGGLGDASTISGGSGWSLSISASIDPAKLEAAEQLVMTIMCTEFATEMSSLGYQPPYKAGEYTIPDESIVAQKFMDFAGGLSFHPVYDHQLSTGLMDVMQSGLQEILNNTKEPATLAADLQAQYELENA